MDDMLMISRRKGVPAAGFVCGHHRI